MRESLCGEREGEISTSEVGGGTVRERNIS